MTPSHLSTLTFVRKLGGTFAARLFSAPDGSCLVVKAGDEDGHTQEEVTADALYRSALLDAPESWYVEDGDDILWRGISDHERRGRKGWRVSRYVRGITLDRFVRRAKPEATKRIYGKLRAGLAMDLLLGNIDVIGHSSKNVVVCSEDRVWRVDNGGALRWTPCQGLKQWEWRPSIWEMEAWLRRPTHLLVFGEVTAETLLAQARGIEASGILAAAPREVRDMLEARLTWFMENGLDGWNATRKAAKLLNL